MTLKVCTVCKQTKEATTENFRKLLRSHDGFRPACRVCTNAKTRERYHKNKEKVYARTKKWRENNRETYNAYIKQYSKTGPVGVKQVKLEGAEEVAEQRDEYMEENAERLRAQRKQNRDGRREEVRAQARAHYWRNRDKILAKQRDRYQKNKGKNREERNTYSRAYYHQNKEKMQAYHRDYYRKQQAAKNQQT